MTLVEYWETLRTSSLVRSVGVLVSGTVVSQLVAVLALPILTRLYSPGDFGVLAVFVALTSTLSVAACLRFDIAIPIPESSADGAGILLVALLSALAVSLLFAVVLLWLPLTFWERVGQSALLPYLSLLPITVFLMAAYNAFQFWFVRAKGFAAIARTRVLQTIAGVVPQVGGGLLSWLPLGLLLGPVFNAAAGSLGLMLNLCRSNRFDTDPVSWARLRQLFVEYNRFPKYSALEALTNSAAIQVPIIAIASLASGQEAGFVFLAMYALQAPMSLVGAAIGQVYLSEAPDHHRRATLAAFTVRVFGGLVKIGAGPLMFAALVAPGLFPIVFGSEWGRAGVLVVWMVPWFLMQLLSSPLSMALHVTNQQRAALVLQVSGLVLRMGAVFVASVVNVRWISEAYAVSGFAFYFLYLVVVFGAVGACSRDVVSQLRNSLPLLSTWFVAGLIFAAAAWCYANG